MIKLENVSFHYKRKKEILKNINLEFFPGEITVIIGKNGSGKTTLCNLLTKFLVGKGKIFIDSENIKKMKNTTLRKKVGIVFQNPNHQVIFNKVYDDIKFALDNLNLDNKEKRIEKALQEMEMQDFQEKNPFELSLGEKQRIAICSQLAIDPTYFILDEITSMIDYKGKQDIYKILKNLKEKGKCIIMTTNIMEEILIADKIIVLEKGIVQNIIKKEELLENINNLKDIFTDIPFIIKVLLFLKEKNIPITSFNEDSILESLNEV